MMPVGVGEWRHHPCGKSGPLYTLQLGQIESNSDKPSSSGSLHHLQLGMRTTRQRNLEAMKDRMGLVGARCPGFFLNINSNRSLILYCL